MGALYHSAPYEKHPGTAYLLYQSIIISKRSVCARLVKTHPGPGGLYHAKAKRRNSGQTTPGDRHVGPLRSSWLKVTFAQLRR